MARRFFNDGQEITFEDLNGISSALEQMLMDRVLPELTRGQYDRVFGTSFQVGFVNATSVSVAAGIGVQYDAAQTSPEPTKRLLYKASSSNSAIEGAHATNNRVDIVSIKAQLATELSDTRKFKDASTSVISNVSMTIQKDWGLDIIVTKGVEDGTEAIPSTPSGYIKIAEVFVTAATGVVDANAITDRRVRFTYEGYDAVVGSAAYCTHATLAKALADSNVAAGSRIKIMSDETITTAVAINKNNLQLDFMPGVTFTKGGSATSALDITADGVRVNGGRFLSFAGGSDKGIKVSSGGSYAILIGQRFNNCTVDVEDNDGTATVLANVIE